MANAVNARAPLARPRIPSVNHKRVTSRIVPPPIIVQDEEDDIRPNEPQSEMDVEEDVATIHPGPEAEASLLNGEQEVEAMVGVQSSEEEDVENAQLPPAKVQRIWPEISTSRRVRCEKEVRAIREIFHDEVDMYDTTMVSEYAEEIFEYMCDLEVYFCFLSGHISLLIMTHYPGGDDAKPKLHGGPERDYLGNATNACRLAITGPPPLLYVTRDTVDSHQHRRPVPYKACGIAGEAAARGCYGDVHCSEVRRDPRPLRGRVRLHDRERIPQGGDPQRRKNHVADTRIPSVTLLFAVQLDAED